MAPSHSASHQLTNNVKHTSNTTPSYSRACHVCFTPHPLRRAVFPACGHVVCRACAVEMAMNAIIERRPDIDVCPFCRGVSEQTEMREREIPGDSDSYFVRLEVLEISLEKHMEAVCKEDVIISNANRKQRRAKKEAKQADHVMSRAANVILYAVKFRKSARIAIRRAAKVSAKAKRAGRVAKYTKLVIETSLRRLAKANDKKMRAEAAIRSIRRKMERANARRNKHLRACIECLRMENELCESVGIRHSRECTACRDPNPRHRVFFAECHHVVCRPCANESDGARCPDCESPGDFVQLHEDLIVEGRTN